MGKGANDGDGDEGNDEIMIAIVRAIKIADHVAKSACAD
jgi:hypothetical protein